MRVTGVVLDAETQEILPAVTIRLRHSTLGTSSGNDGSFSLAVPVQYRQDTLLFSRLGYADLPVALLTLQLGQTHRLYLHKQQAVLGPVAITARKWVERKVGITNAKALIHFTDGTMLPGEPFEIAQLMRVGSGGAALTSVNLYLAADTPDSTTIALRFYRVADDQPTTQLVDHPIYRRVALRRGWLRLDLTPHNLYVAQDFALGLAFMPDSTARYAVPYEIKLGGSAKSFARRAGESVWHIPPHHYRLYVTARVPEHTLPANVAEADNRETPASARLYSAAAQDSFSLFVRLPKGYAQSPKRRYPVLVLLDGNIYVDAVGDELNKQPRRSSAILVGVGHRDFLQQDSLRQRDYTYPAALPADSLPLSGGGRRFLTFLERELLPYLDRTYRIDGTQRTLMGHSFGGYFTVYALLESLKTDTCSFTQYVAASPSLYYQNQYLLRELTALARPVPHQPVRLYLTIGEREMTPPTAEGAANKAAFQGLLDLLATKKFSAIAVEQHIYPRYTHMETAVSTFTDSLKKLLRKPMNASRQQP